MFNLPCVFRGETGGVDRMKTGRSRLGSYFPTIGRHPRSASILKVRASSCRAYSGAASRSAVGSRSRPTSGGTHRKAAPSHEVIGLLRRQDAAAHKPRRALRSKSKAGIWERMTTDTTRISIYTADETFRLLEDGVLRGWARPLYCARLRTSSRCGYARRSRRGSGA
jgi:hypothetical protein